MNELEALERFDQPALLTDDALTEIEFVRDTMKIAADQIMSVTPNSREQSLALTKLEEAMFWANAAVARADIRLQKQFTKQGEDNG